MAVAILSWLTRWTRLFFSEGRAPQLLTIHTDGRMQNFVVDTSWRTVSKAVDQTVGYSCPSSPWVDFWTLLTSSHVSVNHEVTRMLTTIGFVVPKLCYR